MFAPEASSTEINFPSSVTAPHSNRCLAPKLCSRAAHIYSAPDCSERYWKPPHINESPAGRQLKIIPEDRAGSPPGFHKRASTRVPQWNSSATSPIDPYKASPHIVPYHQRGSPMLLEAQCAPPCYRVFPASNVLPMSPLAPDTYRQWSPPTVASPMRPWNARVARATPSEQVCAAAAQGQLARLNAAVPGPTRPPLGLMSTAYHVARAVTSTELVKNAGSAAPTSFPSPSCALPPTSSVQPVSNKPPDCPDPALEAKLEFARDLQQYMARTRWRFLIPESIRKADAEERTPVDMNAYTAVAFPATMAYVEAMGILLHKIIDVSYPRHRYEKQFRFDAVSVPEVAIGDYLERLRCFFLCSPECFVLAMIYIDRLVRLYDGKVVLCSLNIHRILVTAVTVAAKFFDDVYYSNSFYAKIGGLSLEEMNVLESHFLHLIKYDLYVSPREYERYRHNVTLLHSSSNPHPQNSKQQAISPKTVSTSSSTPLHPESPSSTKSGWPSGPLFEDSMTPSTRETALTHKRINTSAPHRSHDDLLVSTSSTHCSTPSNNEYPSPST